MAGAPGGRCCALEAAPSERAGKGARRAALGGGWGRPRTAPCPRAASRCSCCGSQVFFSRPWRCRGFRGVSPWLRPGLGRGRALAVLAAAAVKR